MYSLLLTLIIPYTIIDTQLLKLESETGCEFIMTSRDRTVEHNRRVGGAKNSYHLKVDTALDVVPRCAMSYSDIGVIAKKYFNGVIVYSDHLHLDLREDVYYLDKTKT